MTAYAHTHPAFPTDPSKWEPLFTPFGDGADECQRGICLKCQNLEPNHGHLNKVAFWGAKFAAEMFAPDSDESKSAHDWGYLAGLWHDLGKFAPVWQRYLQSKADPHIDDVSGKVDHSTAGAILAHGFPPLGSLFSYVIAGHHAGLADGSQLFPVRLKKSVEEWYLSTKASGVPLDEAIPCPPLVRENAGNDAMAFMLRFFFSCLVDADFLATEAFMQSGKSRNRSLWPDDIISQMLAAFENHLGGKFANAQNTPVNQARESVRHACNSAANQPTGFFSLTVPTGGGKTLSSLLFALRHAHEHGLRRVIYVIPYTSIITQNAEVFRVAFKDLSKQLGRELVLEHHSKFDPKRETEANRLSAENWDSPLVVTTNVRFFESLFANRTSACRKLHRIARSVVIFDEVQALPPRLLHPVLRSLNCLVKDLRSSVVLCTATQPALDQRDGFTIGIPPEEIHPIIYDEAGLFDSLKRVEPSHLGSLDDNALVTDILDNAPTGCLLILNTTKAAQVLHEKLSKHLPAFHLSARMCPRHIMTVLARVKRLRRKNSPVVLVSTQLIEAGVDVSFPVVYRAECGLDSFAQAAGRCNRNGELATTGRAYLFAPTDHPIPKALHDIATAAAITRTQVQPHHSDLLSLQAIRSFFEHAIWQAGRKTNQWDEPGIVSGGMPCFAPNGGTLDVYQFQTAAEKFRIIESNTHPILIPWGAKGKALAEEIRNLDLQKRSPNRTHYRRAQAFTVQVYENEWAYLKHHVSLHADGAIAILTHPENQYHPDTGLKRQDAPNDPNAFCL